MSKAGEFELSVSAGHPCWVGIIYNGKQIAQIHHSELSDLQYALEKAMRETKIKLRAMSRDPDEV